MLLLCSISMCVLGWWKVELCVWVSVVSVVCGVWLWCSVCSVLSS